MYLFFFFFFFVVFFLSLIICLYNLYVWGYKGEDKNIGLDSWISSFECGFMSHGFSENFFSFSYLNLLVFFVIFDLEVSLLLNIAFDGVWFNSFLYYLVFILLVVISYMFEVYYGYISWYN
uniref:NADH-ubiquinone oxidoreductase chain 3 n=1 Tax=Schistosoma malayensis TaxID=53353 RepID=Q9B892_9TREM|nr:NADH dehydrogenase subunit 3 [Schistosoma malayensis]